MSNNNRPFQNRRVFRNRNYPQNNNNQQNATLTSSEIKFKEAQNKLQAAVEKHIKQNELSSEEEDNDDNISGNLIDDILKNYTQTGGKEEYLGRTKTFLENSFHSGSAICLICIARIKRDQSIWDCIECYCLFHLDCIQKWAKDCMFQHKQALENPIQSRKLTPTWNCPKCRCDYNFENIPTKYYCYCKKNIDPIYQPLLVPHSCGEICKKDLKPYCGHKCLLLCHPGPCPPCPVTVSSKCYCGNDAPRFQRCSNKEWSCGKRCGKLLACGKHTCPDNCHSGDCKPCSKKSLQKCLCQSEQKLRNCANPVWQCDKVCNKPLDCGNHNCPVVCHAGSCESCQLTKPRNCPCGKTIYTLDCTKETPTCPDTCDKLLDCGLHKCNQRCHKDNCGPCLETVNKRCRCGLHSKDTQCSKPYLCDTKCKQMRDCNKHPCNRKCCDGSCPPCEKICGRTLNCGNHKCNLICHRGSCYPCNQTDTVTCRCGATKLVVSCGRKLKTKPPKCNKQCIIPPDCHHQEREFHKCHFGDCPPCRLPCKKARSTCSHLCSAACHSAVFIKVEAEKASMPWEQTKPTVEKKCLPCPDCEVPVPVTCFGGHETADWPCHIAKPSSCYRLCGRLLECQNHECSMPCHVVEGAPDDTLAGTNCETCESPCSKPRPEGCVHECEKLCHPGDCPPCTQMVRVRCHCTLHLLYVNCNKLLNPELEEAVKSCGNQCPKMYECGHRCKLNCHSGPCTGAELCKKKVKIFCKCKRIKKEFSCETVRAGNAQVECDEICKQKKEEQMREIELLNEQKRKEEELKNKKELEKYQKIFEGKKKTRARKNYGEEVEPSIFQKYRIAFAVGVMVVVLGISLVFWE